MLGSQSRCSFLFVFQGPPPLFNERTFRMPPRRFPTIIDFPALLWIVLAAYVVNAKDCKSLFMYFSIFNNDLADQKLARGSK